jgi:hypothetical protein
MILDLNIPVLGIARFTEFPNGMRSLGPQWHRVIQH